MRNRAVSPSCSPGTGIRSSASTAHRTCSPTCRGVSQMASSASLRWTNCRCPMIRWTSSSALALVHVPRLQPVLAEFARVQRPRGDLVISDLHHELVTRGSVIKARGPAGEPCIAATYRHWLGDYLRAALSLGLQVRRREEPGAALPAGPLPEPATGIADWQDWPWSLMDYSAARAARGCPSLVTWHFQLPAAARHWSPGTSSSPPPEPPPAPLSLLQLFLTRCPTRAEPADLRPGIAAHEFAWTHKIGDPALRLSASSSWSVILPEHSRGRTEWPPATQAGFPSRTHDTVHQPVWRSAADM
jgi:hypothetical protein